MKIEVGKKIPAFKFKNIKGEWVKSADLLGSKYVLYFYPKDLTPGCTQEACDFRDLSEKFKKKKVKVFGVSKDSAEMHEKFIKKYDLNFPLLTDESGDSLEKLGVWREKSMYGRKYMGIARVTFIIDEVGKIQKIYDPVKVKGHGEQVLSDL